MGHQRVTPQSGTDIPPSFDTVDQRRYVKYRGRSKVSNVRKEKGGALSTSKVDRHTEGAGKALESDQMRPVGTCAISVDHCNRSAWNI
jgi:hypothetical protein